jgi:molybdopterin/thiamine biosynthesis adenylyltransferase
MDLTRHRYVFDPAQFNDRQLTVAVIGAGALGSQVALHLSKLGLDRVYVIDDDQVEGHNLPNQLTYGEDDIGKYKAVALANRLNLLRGGSDFGADVVWPVVRRAPIGYVAEAAAVFVCVDSMKARKEIADFAFTNCPPSTLLIDGRIGAYTGSALISRVGLENEVEGYRQTLYSDSDVQPDTGSCGETLSIGATASIIAAQMVWLFMQRFSTAEIPRHVNEVIFSVNPWSLMARSF